MQEGADELWAHVLGGYNDLAQVLTGPIQVLPFLPVLCGEDEKVFMSVYVRPLATVFALHREHVGRFMPRTGGGRGGGHRYDDEDDERAGSIGETNAHALQNGYRGRFDRAELLRWCRLAQEVLSKKSVVKADCVTAEALRDYCAEVSSDEAAVERARDLLNQLSAIVADTEAAHSQQTQCEMTYSRCAAELKLFPHHCFEHLADELTHYYVHRHGEYFRAPLALARLLTVPHALPTEYARAVFLPLYLPVFGEKKVVKTFGNGESSEVCVYTLKYKPFCGFGYSVPDANVYEHWTDPEQAPDDYAHLRRYLTVDKCVKSHSQRLIARFYKTLQGLREIAKTDDKWLPALRRWTEWDECVHQQHGTFHQRQMRRMFGTELGIAVLQSQVSMGCQPYAAASLACVHQHQQQQQQQQGQGEEEQQRQLLAALIKFTRGRVQKTGMMLKANNLNYFTMKDVTSVRMELSGAQSAGIVMHKMNYVPDTQRDQVWVKRAFEELRLPYSIASRNAYVPNVLQLGLWSPYNSTECTQWGNFNAKDPNKTGGVVSVQHRETLTELNAQTFKKWQYEFKQLPGSEPGNPLAWVYCARGALFTTLGAFHAYTVDKYGALTTEPKVGDTVQAMVQDLTLHILRGFYHKLRAGPGEYGLTFRQTGATNTIRAYAMSSAVTKPMDATSLSALNRLQWTQVGDEDSEKMRYLAATYPLKRLVGQWLRTGEPVYYKRAFYTSPIAATFNESYVMRMRNNFVYAPFALLTSQNVVMSAIKCVSFSASTTIPWKNVDIYKVILDTNSFYSQEKRSEWDLGGSSAYTGIDGQGNGEADAGEIVRFLTEEYDGQEVPSSALNMYRFPKDKYLSIVHMLKNQSMYYEDVPPVYAPDPLPRGALHCGDPDDDDLLERDQDGAADVQRQASYALHALENPGFAQKRKVLTREPHFDRDAAAPADFDEGGSGDDLSDLEKIMLKNSNKRQKLLGNEHV